MIIKVNYPEIKDNVKNEYLKKYLINIAEIHASLFPYSYKHTSVQSTLDLFDKGRVLFLDVEDDIVKGVVGAIPQYEYAWELHPLLVSKEYQNKGIGTLLLKELEEELQKRNIYTIYLGSDDTEFKTSLAEGELFTNILDKIDQIKNYKNHPYTFYQKNGYVIVGAIPNANGVGKPDIWLAKDIRKVITVKEKNDY